MTRYAAKTDTNHADVRDRLRRVPGMVVIDVSMYPGFGCDLLVGYQNGPPHLVEVKASPKDKLTESEKKLQAKMGDYWIRAERYEDVLAHYGLSNDMPPF